jgi:hypothetical protein
MQKPIYLFLLLLFPACLFAQSQPDSSIKLDTFKGLPKEIDGCGETFSYKDTPLKEEKYIWITNLQGLGMIRVGGKLVHLHRVSETTSGKNHKEVYKGGGYVIVVKTKEVKQIDEETFETGTLEISFGGKVATFVIHGSGGC